MAVSSVFGRAMLQRCSALLSGLLLSFCTLAVRAEVDQASFVSLSASVLRVEAPLLRGGYSLGSAVVVADQTIITNCHVTQDTRQVSILRGGVRWPALPVISDVEHDLCLLRVPGLEATPVQFAPQHSLKVGQTVTALGYTGGLGLQRSAGEVVRLHQHDGAQVIQSSNWFSSGASGGGLFDDDVRLVGILTFRLRGGEAHYFAAPAQWVQRILESAERSAPQASPGTEPFWRATGAAQPRFLRAAVMLRDDRWAELEAMATQWSREEPGEAEPWYLLGKAAALQGRAQRAREALACALKIEPAHAPARESLRALGVAPPPLASAAETQPCAALNP